MTYILTNIINWAQVVINPTIYVVYHKRYRFAIKNLLRKMMKSKRQDGQTFTFESTPRGGSSSRRASKDKNGR